MYSIVVPPHTAKRRKLNQYLETPNEVRNRQAKQKVTAPANTVHVRTVSWAPSATVMKEAFKKPGHPIFSNLPAAPALTDSQSKFLSPPILSERDLMYPRSAALEHPAAADLLQFASQGCPLNCGKNWTTNELEQAIANGAHKSASGDKAATACRKEALERVRDGRMRIVKWNDIKNDPPANLKISPIAAIPHKSRDYRMILDLAFTLKLDNGLNLQSVNDASDKTLAPHHSMYELGNVIPRIIQEMAAAPNNGVPILFTKIDLKDGYWRMVVSEDDAWNFAYVLPPENATDDIQLVIPDALQMGWSESPPFFCAATETARDLAEHYYGQDIPCPSHSDENIILNIDWAELPPEQKNPDLAFLHLLEVYIDDFIGLIQSVNKNEILKFTRCILKGIADIFPPPHLTNSKMEPPISAKKLVEEGAWETKKEILGWLLDGLARTIQLPHQKCDKLLAELRTIRRTKHNIKLNALQKLQGKLTFTSIGIPLGKPLLGTLDKEIAIADRHNKKYVKISPSIQNYCRTWAGVIHLMRRRPSHVNELTKRDTNAYRGFVDASKWGVGGVWFAGTKPLAPFVWFVEWPEDIRNKLISPANPNGTLSISDLELIGILMHWLALEQAVTPADLLHQSPAIWCDNLPGVSWIYKFRTSKSHVASAILLALATRLHKNKTGLIAVDHISGLFNTLADVASRKHSTNPATFLVQFTKQFPPPQNACWTLFQFNNKLKSLIFSTLQQKQLTMASWSRLCVKGCDFSELGPNGLLSSSPKYNPTFKMSTENHSWTCWLPSPAMLDKAAFHEENSKFAPKRSRWHSGVSPRSYNWTENKTRWLTRKENIRKRLINFWKDSGVTTLPPNQC